MFLGNYRYRGAYGGRGSGKTRSFAKMVAVKGYQLAKSGKLGVILCAREYMNSLSHSSFAEIKAAINSEAWLSDFYQIGENFIRTKCHRIEFIFTGLRYNLDSLKSKAKIHICWVDEAEAVSEEAWQKLIPTVREEGAEIWVTWNPEKESSATHKRFRLYPPPNSKIVEVNWQDNPWFPAVLEQERQHDLIARPQYYKHIWDGDFVSVIEGAYFAQELLLVNAEKRITQIVKDPFLPITAFWDIGGTGANADATSIWLAQLVGKEIRVLDYYEAKGQPLETHIAWLRSNKYDNALMVLPHDGNTKDKVYDVSFKTYLEQAAFEVIIIPNQGRGAARLRIEAVRRLFPYIYFNESSTVAGRQALAAYHEKRDSVRNIGLGPNHDWSSHAADSFGLMALFYQADFVGNRQGFKNDQIGMELELASSWMAG